MRTISGTYAINTLRNYGAKIPNKKIYPFFLSVSYNFLLTSSFLFALVDVFVKKK